MATTVADNWRRQEEGKGSKSSLSLLCVSYKLTNRRELLLSKISSVCRSICTCFVATQNHYLNWIRIKIVGYNGAKAEEMKECTPRRKLIY